MNPLKDLKLFENNIDIFIGFFYYLLILASLENLSTKSGLI